MTDALHCPYCKKWLSVEVILHHIFHDHPESDMATDMAIEIAYLEQGIVA